MLACQTVLVADSFKSYSCFGFCGLSCALRNMYDLVGEVSMYLKSEINPDRESRSMESEGRRREVV